MSAIQENVVIQSDGVLELRLPQLHAGDMAEVIVTIRPAKTTLDAKVAAVPSWYRFIGCLGSGGRGNSNNESIDRDLAASYLDKHESAE